MTGRDDSTGERTPGGRDRDERDRGRAEDRNAGGEGLPNRTSAGSTGQAGQSSVDSPGFSEKGRRDGRQGLTDPSRDWPGPDEKKEANDAE
jgi:hypothetical protein